jgi:hypothetical protein
LIFSASIVAWAQTASEPPDWRVRLNPALSDWRNGIEALDARPLVTARIPVVNGAYFLAPDLPERPTLVPFFRDDSFRGQFVRTHALSLNTARARFVLLNQQRLRLYPGTEEDLLSHEFGHAWLDARGFKAPPFRGGPLACEPIHTGDIVQHIAIRAEQDRRGFAFRPGWIRSLAQALNPEIEPARDPCTRLERLSLYADTALGLDAAQWPDLPVFLEQLVRNDPKLAQTALRLRALLPHFDVTRDRVDYYAALGAVRSAAALMFE